MKLFKINKTLVILAAVLTGATALLGGTYLNNRIGNHEAGDGSITSHPIYSLSLSSGNTYRADGPNKLTFKIKSNDGKLLKDYETAHEKIMHFIVVRKDLANFQHVHPEFNANSGEFTLGNFNFPTDGEYRLFADFTPSTSQKNEAGIKLPVILKQDVKAGNISRYTPQPLGDDRLVSSAADYQTNILKSDDNSSLDYVANTEITIPIEVLKNGQSYKSLEKYLGALGHMVVIGEKDLEYIHAHAISESVDNQTGTIQFAVTFPKAGRYKIFLQTQAEGKVLTTDYTVTVKNGPNSQSDQQNSIEHEVSH